jgi:flap endonuclease-1
MGIHNLSKVIKTYAEGGITTIEDTDIRGKVLALDTSNILYQFLIAIKNNTDDFTTKSGKITTHIHAILMKTMSLIKRGIKPVFVFDGAPPSIKGETLKNRDKHKEKAKIKLSEATDEEEIKKYKKRMVSVSQEQMDECKELLQYMGIPYVDALEEADSQCVYLVKKGMADGVGSEDMDILTFGAARLYRNINSTGKMVEYNLETILEELEFDKDQFIDMCILLGCDYCPTIEGVGMKRAYDLMKEHGSIEGVLKHTKFKASKEFMEKYPIARRYFKKAPVYAVDKNDIQWKDIDRKMLEKLLRDKYEYSEKNIQKTLNVLDNRQKELLGGFIKTKCSIYDEDDMFSD